MNIFSKLFRRLLSSGVNKPVHMARVGTSIKLTYGACTGHLQMRSPLLSFCVAGQRLTLNFTGKNRFNFCCTFISLYRDQNARTRQQSCTIRLSPSTRCVRYRFALGGKIIEDTRPLILVWSPPLFEPLLLPLYDLQSSTFSLSACSFLRLSVLSVPNLPTAEVRLLLWT